MNELDIEKKIKEEFTKDAERYSPNDLESIKKAASDEKQAKTRWSRLSIAAACLSFAIIAAAVIGIMLTIGKNGGIIDNSNASGGLDPGTSDEITGEAFVERHPELASLPEGYTLIYLTRNEQNDYETASNEYTGDEAAEIYGKLFNPEKSVLVNKIAVEQTESYIIVNIHKDEGIAYQFCFYSNGYFYCFPYTYGGKILTSSICDWYYDTSFAEKYNTTFAEKHPDLIEYSENYEISINDGKSNYLCPDSATGKVIYDYLINGGMLYSVEGDIDYSTDVQTRVIVNYKDANLQVTYKIDASGNLYYKYICEEGYYRTEYYYNPYGYDLDFFDNYIKKSLSDKHPELADFEGDCTLNYKYMDSELILVTNPDKAYDLYKVFFAPYKSEYLYEEPEEGDVFWRVIVHGNSTNYEFIIYPDGCFKLSYETKKGTITEWYRNPDKEWMGNINLAFSDIHPDLAALPEGYNIICAATFLENGGATLNGAEASEFYLNIVNPESLYIVNSESVPSINGVRYVDIMMSDWENSYKFKVYENGYVWFGNSEWYSYKDIGSVTYGDTFADENPDFVSLSDTKLSVTGKGIDIERYKNISKDAGLIWNLLTSGGEICRALPGNGYPSLFIRSDNYIRISWESGGAGCTATVYESGYIIFETGGDTKYYRNPESFELEMLVTIVAENGTDSFNMAVFGSGEKSFAYIGGVKYIINEYYINEGDMPEITVKGLDYLSFCTERLVIIGESKGYDYPYATDPCYISGNEKWYPICVLEKYSSSWDVGTDTDNWLYDIGINDMLSVRVDGEWFTTDMSYNRTEGEYYVTYHGAERLCDREIVINKNGILYVYPYCSNVHEMNTNEYMPVAETYSRTIEPLRDFNISEIMDGVQYVYEVRFDEDHTFRVSRPLSRDGAGGGYYYHIAYYNCALEKWEMIATETEIPGGIYAIYFIRKDVIEIIGNKDGSSKLTYTFDVSREYGVQKTAGKSSGGTFAEAHPDKVNIPGYVFVWEDEISYKSFKGGIAKDIAYSKIICGGNIKRVDDLTEIPEGVRSFSFAVCAEGTDDEFLMYFRVYENGYLKYHTGYANYDNSYYELYYNPEGFDIDKLFFSKTDYIGDSPVYFLEAHPEFLSFEVGCEITLTDHTGTGSGKAETYGGVLARKLFDAVIGSAYYCQCKTDASSLGGYYSFKLNVNGTEREIRVYEDIMAYNGGEGWEYYPSPYYLDYVSKAVNEVRSYIRGENADFKIDGIKINYKVNYDENHVFAVAKTDAGAGSGFCKIWYTSDGGKNWKLICEDTRIGGYVQCMKAIKANTLMYIDNANGTDETSRTYYINSDGSTIGGEEAQGIALSFIYNFRKGDSEAITAMFYGELREDYFNMTTSDSCENPRLFNGLNEIFYPNGISCYNYNVMYNNGHWRIKLYVAPYPFSMISNEIDIELTCENDSYLISNIVVDPPLPS